MIGTDCIGSCKILAFRRDKNLKDILVHKKHNSMFFKQEHKCEPCSRNCANVVYALFCKHCDKFIYVGETGDTLYQRHLLNLSLLRRQKPDPIAIHFNSTEHSVNDYEIVALEKFAIILTERQSKNCEHSNPMD